MTRRAGSSLPGMHPQDPTDIVAALESAEEAEQRAQLRAEQEAADLNWLMSCAAGRRIARGFLERAGVFRLSFQPDPLATAFSEGGRNEGLRLLNMIHQHAPDQYITMMKEKSLD